MVGYASRVDAAFPARVISSFSNLTFFQPLIGGIDEICTRASGRAARDWPFCSGTQAGTIRCEGPLHQIRIPDTYAGWHPSVYVRVCSQGRLACVSIPDDTHSL